MLYRMQDARKIRLTFDPFAKGFTPEQLTDAHYRLTCDPKQALLILECADMADMDAEYGGEEQTCDGCSGNCAGCGNTRDDGMVLEAVRVRSFSRTAQTMMALAKSLNRYMADKGLTVGEANIGKPRQSGMFATVTVQFPVSDGQTITIVFHSPDNNKMKITAADEILAFRWLLNKRDITVAVSPEGEADVSLEEVGKRVAMLVGKNAKAFATKSKDIAEQKASLETVRGQVEAEQVNNQTLLATLTETQAQAEKLDSDIQAATAQLTKVQEFNAELQSQVDSLAATIAGNKGKGGTGGGDGYAAAVAEFTNVLVGMGFDAKEEGSFKLLLIGGTDAKPRLEEVSTNFYEDGESGSIVVNADKQKFKAKSRATAVNAFDKAVAVLQDQISGRETVAQWAAKYAAVVSQFHVGDTYRMSRQDFVSKSFEKDSYMDGYAVSSLESSEFGGSNLPAIEFRTDSTTMNVRYDKLQGYLSDGGIVPMTAPAIDATSPSGYALIIADPELQLKYQDVLDAFFQDRIVAVRNALRGLDWLSKDKNPKLAYAFQKTVGETTFIVDNDYVQVGAGANVVGVTARIQSITISGEESKVGDEMLIPDDLTGTPEEFAAKINGAIPSVASPETTTTADPGDTNPDRAEENAAVTILNSIIAGEYATSAEMDAALDEAASMLEGMNMLELYDERLNTAADALSQKLADEAAGV